MANQHRPWNEEELQYIRDNYRDKSPKIISEELGRSHSNVYRQMKLMDLVNPKGCVQWAPEEEEFLVSNYKTMKYSEIGERLNKTASAVQQHLKKMGYTKETHCANWTDKEKQFLIDNIDCLNYSEISKEIGRSIHAIYTKASEMDLVSKDTMSMKLKKEQQMYIVANADKMTDKELAIKFGTSVEAVSAVRKKYGIKKTGQEVSGKTYPERVVEGILHELEIEYVYNEMEGEYRPDYRMGKFIIEVHGDYYHCNPYLYPDGPKDEIQIKHVLRDYYKKCYYLSRGYKILYIWEYDIHHNMEDVNKQIRDFCRLGGNAYDYESGIKREPVMGIRTEGVT